MSIASRRSGDKWRGSGGVPGTRSVFAERTADGYFLDVTWDRKALAALAFPWRTPRKRSFHRGRRGQRQYDH